VHTYNVYQICDYNAKGTVVDLGDHFVSFAVSSLRKIPKRYVMVK